MEVNVSGNCDIDSLRYLRESGLPVPSADSGKGKRLLLTGTSHGDEETLTVALSTKELQRDSTYRQTLTEAGALGLVSYNPKVCNLRIVSVGGAEAPSSAVDIKTTLDKLFAPALVTWNVTIEKPLTVDGITPAGFSTTGLDEASRYTDDMNKVIEAYKKGNNRPANTYVLFFVEATKSDKLGYMPLTGNYGFIFDLGTNIELLAHELSHGAFNLKHTFSDKAFWQLTGPAPKFAEKSTQNLMDYANGIELWKYQWDLIHNPETIVLGSLDEVEGAYRPTPLLAELITDIKPSFSQNENEFLFTPSKYYFGMSSEDVTILFEGKQRKYLLTREENETSQNCNPNDVLTDFDINVNYLNDYANNFFQYSLTFYYKEDKHLAFKIASVDYDNIDAILKFLNRPISSEKQNEIAATLNNYYQSSQDKDCDDIDVYYEGIPDFAIQSRSEAELKRDLVSLSQCLTDEIGTNEESAILNIIDAIGKGSPDNLLKTLRAYIPNSDETIYSRLYDEIDDIGGDNNFSSFAKLLYKYWLQSSYGKKESTAIVPYSSTKHLGFYFDNLDVDSDDGYLNNHIIDDDDNVIYNIDIYTPITTCDISLQNNELRPPSKTIPFFFFKSYDDKNRNSNLLTASELTLDVALTFSGVGNLSKLRYLKSLTAAEKLSVFIGTVQLSSGATNLMLKYTENCGNNKFCEKLSNYLFWVEIGALSMDALTASYIKKAAKEALEQSKNVSNIDKQIVIELESLVKEADVPSGLVVKLSQQGSTKLKSWLSSKSITYVDNAGAKFSGTSAESKIFDDLDAAIGNKSVVETFEDAQGRLLIRTDATAITETKIVSIEVTINGEYKLIEYKAVYSKGGQGGYPKLSANKLTPDFSDNINNCLHPDVVGKKIEITVTGQMNSNTAKIGDVELANQAAGIPGKTTPTGYTWHHMDDFNPATKKCTMQLVKTTEHQKCIPHTGGVKQWENYSGQTYLRN